MERKGQGGRGRRVLNALIKVRERKEGQIREGKARSDRREGRYGRQNIA